MKRIMALSALFAALAVQASPDIVNGIACKVGSSIITIHEFNRTYDYEKRQSYVMGTPVPSKRDVMDRLISEVIVSVESEKRGIIVTDEDLNGVIKNVKEENKLTDEQLVEELRREGMTLETLKGRYKKEIERVRLINVLAADKRTSITEEEMQLFYDDPENRALFAQPAVIKLSRILLPVPQDASYKQMIEVKEKVQRVYELAKSGQDFKSLVQTYSVGPEKERSQGALGTFTRDQLEGLIRAEDLNFIFSLNAGEVTTPIRMADGYHIFRVDEKVPAKELSYEQAREYIRSFILRKKGEEQFLAWLAEKKRTTNIQYMIDVE